MYHGQQCYWWRRQRVGGMVSLLLAELAAREGQRHAGAAKQERGQAESGVDEQRGLLHPFLQQLLQLVCQAGRRRHLKSLLHGAGCIHKGSEGVRGELAAAGVHKHLPVLEEHQVRERADAKALHHIWVVVAVHLGPDDTALRARCGAVQRRRRCAALHAMVAEKRNEPPARGLPCGCLRLMLQLLAGQELDHIGHRGSGRRRGQCHCRRHQQQKLRQAVSVRLLARHRGASCRRPVYSAGSTVFIWIGRKGGEGGVSQKAVMLCTDSARGNPRRKRCAFSHASDGGARELGSRREVYSPTAVTANLLCCCYCPG
mmetsp:Transcript_2030/g.5310  ORF Transcript_2030/g.5310 Transcript_2030/m.5310 type:complete len:315 (-) Transcript_2030:94-1038(-)